MSTLKVNKIQPNSSNHISIDGNTNITGSLVHNGHTTLAGTNVLSGSTVFRGTTTVEGDLTVGGRLTAQEVRTEFDNAGVVFESGSTKFGDTSDDNHAFTGSLGVQGGEFKVTDSGNDVLIATPSNGTFTIGDTQGLGDAALITGDSSLIKVKNNNSTTLTVDNNNRVGIGTESPSGSFHVTVNSSDSYRDFVRFTNGNATLFNINDEGAFSIGDVNNIGDGAYLRNHGDEFSFMFGSNQALSIGSTRSTFNEALQIKNTSGGDATLTLEADTGNTELTGENDNPAILFKQDGGSQNAAVGFNIIDDTSNGTIAGSGNRFWIVNAIDDQVGEGGITFGTAQVDGWTNAIARFMIRGDGKGLFGHPNDNYDKSLGSQFEVYDDRTENTTSDYTLAAYGYVDVSEYPPSQGAGGIISRVKVVDGSTDLGTHAIGMVPGTTTSEILTTGDFAFYAGSDMDTSGATGFAGLIHSGSSNWQIGGTGGSDTDTGYKLTVVGTSKFNSDVLIGGNLAHSGSTSFKTSGKGIEWYMNTDGASIKFYNTGDSDTDSRLEFNTKDNKNEYFRWTHTTAAIGGGSITYESMRLDPINSGSNSRLTISGDLYADGVAIGGSHTLNAASSSILGGYCNSMQHSCSTIAGGSENCIGHQFAFIGAGYCNKISMTSSAIGAGNNNCAYGSNIFIGAGGSNCAGATSSFIGAGSNNTISSTGQYSFLGAGLQNRADGSRSVVVGGEYNCIPYNGCRNVIVGGGCNTTQGCYSFIGGGLCNIYNGGQQQYSAIVGGLSNKIYACEGNGVCNAQFIGGGQGNSTHGQMAAVVAGTLNSGSCSYAIVGGGYRNHAAGQASAVLGGTLNKAAQSCTFVGAGYGNCSNGIYGGIVAGHTNKICTTTYSFIGGGQANIISGSGIASSILGGASNLVTGNCNSILGGCNNEIKPHNNGNLSSVNTIIGGGENQLCDTCYSSVGGNFNKIYDASCSNIAGGYANSISGSSLSSIQGGQSNDITDSSLRSTIVGGYINRIRHDAHYTNIAGGYGNCICNCMYGAIGGGRNNSIACSTGAVIGGGCGNTSTGFGHYGVIGGGCGNTASCYSFIGGGQNNQTDSSYGVVVGGLNNRATQEYSGILGGQDNRVDHVNSFIIGSTITTTAQDYTFVNNLCNVGGGTSDCRLKENIENIPYGLTQVTQLDPVSFNFKDDESKKTKYGFLAQCVKEVMPELVYHHPTQTVDGEPVLQFDKDAVWASTVNAIKELKQEVEALKAEISILKQK